MITEDEAKTKWCPFARSIVSTGGGANRGTDSAGRPPPNVNCIGSACMAWRWDGKRTGLYDKNHPDNGPAAPGQTIAYDPNDPERSEWVRYEGRGHCGLVGKP